MSINRVPVIFRRSVVKRQGTRQLGPRTTRTETSRPVSEDKSARMLRQLGPYYCFIILFNIYRHGMCFRFIHFILISTAHALFLTCPPVSIYGT